MTESRKLAEEIARWCIPYNFKKSGGSWEDYTKFLDGEMMIILGEYEMNYEGMGISIGKHYPDQARTFCKVVPSYYDDPDILEKILDAQPWCCI